MSKSAINKDLHLEKIIKTTKKHEKIDSERCDSLNLSFFYFNVLFYRRESFSLICNNKTTPHGESHFYINKKRKITVIIKCF